MKIIKVPNERTYIASWGDKEGQGSSKKVAVNRLMRELSESDKTKIEELYERSISRLYR